MAKNSITAATAEEPKQISARVIDLVQKSGQFEQLLPAPYRTMGDRFLQRARLYIANSPNRDKIQQCTVASLVTAVLEAGSMGLPIDGRMAHIVPFNCKVKGADGREHWESRATFMPDYKGIVNVARRHGTIVDGYAHHVYQRDVFHRALVDGKWEMNYIPAEGDRGEYLGTFAVLLFEQGRFVIEYMVADEIEKIRQRSKSKDNGPWVTDWLEMARKTVLKRAMKTYADDPEVLDLLDKDNAALGFVDDIVESAPPRKIGARKAEPLRLPEAQPDPYGDEGADGRLDAELQHDEPEATPEPQDSVGVDPVEYWKKKLLATTTRAECEAVWAQAEGDQSMDIADTKLVESAFKRIVKNLA